MSDRILITGGAGFIGSHTADALYKQGYKIRILDSLTPPVHQEGCFPKYLSKKYELIKGDITNKKDWLKALKGVDYVYHFAAYQDYLTDFSKFFYVNAVGTALLYELIYAYKLPVKKIIYASSQAVYGGGKGLKETDLLKPCNSYGISKMSAEHICLNFKIPTAVMRYSIVQGSRQSPFNLYSGALRIFTTQAMAGNDLRVFEDGEQCRDFVNIKDVVEANLLVLKNKKADFQAFNIGGGKEYKIIDFARMVQRIVNPDIKIKITGETRMGDVYDAVSDITKFKKLGWKPRYTPEQSIKEYLKWLA